MASPVKLPPKKPTSIWGLELPAGMVLRYCGIMADISEGDMHLLLPDIFFCPQKIHVKGHPLCGMKKGIVK